MTTLALTLVALLATILPGSWLELTRDPEPWRIITSHFVHWNGEQLLWDLLAFVVLGIACERRNRAALHATLVTATLLIPAAVWLFAPDVVAYRGLSGLCSALFVLLLLLDRRPVTLLLGAAFLAKLAFELATASTVFVGDLGAGVVPVPVAHLAGALAAVIVMTPRKSLLLAPLALTSCISLGGTTAPPPPRGACSSTDISGVWVNYRMTFLGPARMRLSFGRDCRYTARIHLLFARFSENGHYRIERDVVHFGRAEGYVTAWKFRRSGYRLELQESGERRLYTHRPCASPSPC